MGAPLPSTAKLELPDLRSRVAELSRELENARVELRDALDAREEALHEVARLEQKVRKLERLKAGASTSHTPPTEVPAALLERLLQAEELAQSMGVQAQEAKETHRALLHSQQEEMERHERAFQAERVQLKKELGCHESVFQAERLRFEEELVRS